MTEQRLTDELAHLVLGWRLAPGRYLTIGRTWIPRSRFRPFQDIREAFRLLDTVTDDYLLRAIPGKSFTVEIRLKGRIGRASGNSKARVITLAVAQLLELEAIP
jgi:hypothetical protein